MCHLIVNRIQAFLRELRNGNRYITRVLRRHSSSKWLRNSLVTGSRTFHNDDESHKIGMVIILIVVEESKAWSGWHADNPITRNTSKANYVLKASRAFVRRRSDFIRVHEDTSSHCPLRCGIVSIGKIYRLFRHLYLNYHCQWRPLVAKWWKVTIPHRTRGWIIEITKITKQHNKK